MINFSKTNQKGYSHNSTKKISYQSIKEVFEKENKLKIN